VVSGAGSLRTSYASNVDVAKEMHDLIESKQRELERKILSLRDDQEIVGYVAAPANGRKLASSTPTYAVANTDCVYVWLWHFLHLVPGRTNSLFYFRIGNVYCGL